MPQTPLSGIIFSRGSTLNAGMHAPQSTEEYPISWPVPDLPALFLRSTMSGVYGSVHTRLLHDHGTIFSMTVRVQSPASSAQGSGHPRHGATAVQDVTAG